MASAFNSNEADCINRCAEVEKEIGSIDEIWTADRLLECTTWIESEQFKRVCLQFPDDLIRWSVHILDDLKKNTQSTLCILGDTSYGSCCVDEVAASHVNAEAIIHFGHACLSKIARLPTHYVFTAQPFNAKQFAEQFDKWAPTIDGGITVFVPTHYYYHQDDIKDALRAHSNVTFSQLAIDEPPTSLCWKLPNDNVDDQTCIWIGEQNQSFFNISITIKPKQWFTYSNSTAQIDHIRSPLETNWMRRRNFFIEKCKDAQSIGIVVGTLATAGYLNAVDRIKMLARNRGTRTYLLSIGKINPAKLANFMDIDCFVFVGCPENNIYTSRDFYRPLLSVFEAELALNPAWYDQYTNVYSVDFSEVLQNGKHHRVVENGTTNGHKEFDISLVTGKVRSLRCIDDGATNESHGTQMERKTNQLMQTNSSSTFQNHSWTGLSMDLGSNEPAKITKGRSGIAIQYSADQE